MFNSEKTQVKEIGKRMKDQGKKKLTFQDPLRNLQVFCDEHTGSADDENPIQNSKKSTKSEESGKRHIFETRSCLISFFFSVA
jgi:hypothetical protein